MEPQSSDIREKDERRRSFHRTFTAPPDAQEPQYHSYSFNIGAEEFNPLKPISNINPQAKPFEPLFELPQTNPMMELSAGAPEFVPTYVLKNSLPKKVSAWDIGKGPSLKSPTPPACKEVEITAVPSEKEIKEEKSVSTEEEQEEKPVSSLLTTDNNQIQISSISQPDLESQLLPTEPIPNTLTELQITEQPTPLTEQIIHETEPGRSEFALIKPLEPLQIEHETQPEPTEIEVPSTETQQLEPEKIQKEEPERIQKEEPERIQQLEPEKIQQLEPEKIQQLEPEKIPALISEDKLKRYSYKQICSLASLVSDSDVNPKVLAFTNRTIKPENCTYNLPFKPHMKKRGRVATEKRRQAIERQVYEENKDNPQWRYINEQVELIAQKAKETTKKVAVVHEGDEKVQRQVKVTLNKLTPSNFEKLKDSLLQIALVNDANVKYLVDGIFLKACTESKYTPMYAKLCKYLLEEYHKIKFNEEFGRSRENKRNNSFRRELLQNCQSVFEYNPQEENYEGLSEEDAQIKKEKLKKKILGNVRLVGELFKLGLILNKIVLYCIEDLIHPKFKNESELDYSPQNFNEEKLEGACILLKTGGLSFEKPSVINYTDKVFRVLRQIVDRNIASARTRFLIMNVIDARTGGWKTEEQDMPKVIA